MQGLVNDAWKELHLETRLLQPNAPNKAALDGEAKSGQCTTCAFTESCTMSCLLIVCIMLQLFRLNVANSSHSGVQQQSQQLCQAVS